MERDPIVPGFRFAGLHAGIKKQSDRLDLGLIACERPVAAAAVFTRNRVKAAPVLLSAKRIARGACQAIIVNSGNANACTGKRGVADAKGMGRAIASALGIDESLVCVASTGVIGAPLPIDRIETATPRLAAALSERGLADFSRAILTTDKGPKVALARRRIGRREITIAGAAKGAGMIAPNMATTLSFVMTDAVVSPAYLRTLLRQEVEGTLNRATVDGDTSTNDSCFLLASGAGGGDPLRRDDRSGRALREALREVLSELTRKLVSDGEGATKLVTIAVERARSERDALLVARRVANSPLVKTALFGADPNWGRILGAIGNAGVAIDPDRIELSIGGVPVVRKGQAVESDWERPAHEVMQRAEYEITIALHAGRARAAYLTCDFGHEYVRINADYRS